MFPIRFLCCLCLFIEIQGTTYWMVTEDGLIRPKEDSPFEISRPYDLLAFLNQDIRWNNIGKFYQNMKEKSSTIDKLWNNVEKYAAVAERFLEDENCVKAGALDTLNWYKPYYEDGRFRIESPEYYSISKPQPNKVLDVPDCKKISSLTFSMETFEHLTSMINRQNLTIDLEQLQDRPTLISEKGITVEQMGNWLAGMLKKNSTSWIHYNIASFYWRVFGNAPKAIECSRRAVHYSPREFKDISLFNMGMILHRSKRLDDAIVVLGAAYDHDPNHVVNNIVLANALALHGDFNSSITHFNKCYVLDPKFDEVEKYRAAANCHWGLIKKMEKIEKKIIQLRQELSEFNEIEAFWMKTQAEFLRTMYRDTDFDYTNVETNSKRITELTGLDIKEMHKIANKYYLIEHFFDGPMYDVSWFKKKGVDALESANSLDRFVKHLVKQINMMPEYENNPESSPFYRAIKRDYFPADFHEYSSDKEDDDEENPSFDKVKDQKDTYEYETGGPLYANSIIVDRTTLDFDAEPGWPSDEYCKKRLNNIADYSDIIYPVFLPFENKGIWVSSILSEKIGVAVDESHELPWRPPLCTNDSSGFTIKKLPKTTIPIRMAHPDYLRTKLLEYVGDVRSDKVYNMPDTEIGQRIHTAMELKVAPKWILNTLASLYWRVRDNKVNAMHCLLMANKTVPSRHRDVVLTSMSSVYLETGHFEEAVRAAEEASQHNFYEPATNMAVAQINMVKEHVNSQLFHIKQALRVEPDFLWGHARLLLDAWACTAKLNKAIKCIEKDGGMGVVCGVEGSTNCQLKNDKNCNLPKTKPKVAAKKWESQVATYEASKKTVESKATYFDQKLVDSLVDAIPYAANHLAHDVSYRTMRKNLEELLGDCGPDGCLHMRNDELMQAIKPTECTFQHLQLGYWMHLLSLRQLLAEAVITMPEEIINATPSQKMVPECTLQVDPANDFYLLRLKKIKVNNWEPILSLMQQVAEMFGYYDYVTLGSKIAKFLEHKPNDFIGQLAAAWWCGAGGHSACAMQCILAAYSTAPPHLVRLPFVTAVTLTHLQSQLLEAKEISYLMFYLSPRTKLGSFMVAVAHTYLGEYEQAVWMFRYALSLDDKYLPATACLHATLCLMIYGDSDESDI